MKMFMCSIQVVVSLKLELYFYVQENFEVNHWIFQTTACFHSFHVFNDRTNWFFIYLADVLNLNRCIIFAFAQSICQQTSYLNWSFFSTQCLHSICCTVSNEINLLNISILFIPKKIRAFMYQFRFLAS